MASSVFQSAGLVSFRVVEQKGTRNEKGRFTNAQTVQRERNRDMAHAIQERAANLIEQRIIWRAESTGNLARNTLAPENAQYDTWSVGVGNEDFLDDSSSKYWRTFEWGSLATWKHEFVGTHLFPRRGGKDFGTGGGPITGFWTDTEGTSKFVVRHEIQGQHVYDDAATESALRDFGIRNVRQYVRDLLA